MYTTLIGILMTLVGWILYRRGRRLPVDPHTPYCRRCGYNLTGLTSGRCPECGSDVTQPRAVMMGVGRRALRMKRWGLALLVAGLPLTVIFGTASFRRFPWYHFLPNSWVFRDAESSSEIRQMKGYLELQRRLTAGRLSETDVPRLVLDALAEQGRWDLSPSTSSWVAQTLVALRRAGALTAAQDDLYGLQCHLLKLVVRPTVLPDRPIPVGITAVGRMDFNIEQQGEILTVRVDGRPVELAVEPWHVYGCGSPRSVLFSLPSLPPGKHELECDVRTGEAKFAPGQSAYVYLNGALDRTLKAEFEVLTEKPEGYVKRTPSVKIAAELSGMIEFQRPFVSSRFDSQQQRLYPRLNGYLQVSALKSLPQVRSLPVSLAFDVLVRWEGVELLLGRCVFDKNEFYYQKSEMLTADVGFDLPAEVRVILRASEEAALANPNVYEIWDGELDLGIKRVENHATLEKFQEFNQRMQQP